MDDIIQGIALVIGGSAVLSFAVIIAVALRHPTHVSHVNRDHIWKG